jgi:branched-chain amino acid transport system permease protein
VDKFLTFAISGLVVGSLYSLMALGFVTLYKCTKVPNFAQGAFGLVAAYTTWELASHGQSFVVALIAGAGVAGTVGFLADRLAMRHLLGSSPIALIIFTYGLDMVITTGVQDIWGPQIETLKLPESQNFFHIATLSIAYSSVIIIVFGLGVLALCGAFFRYTRLGLATRATATNRSWPSLVGVNVPSTMSFSWALAGVLGAFAGIFLSGVYYLEPSLMDTFLLPAFTAAAIGGFGSILGAYVGGLILGIVQDLAAGYLGAPWTVYSVSILLAVVLLVRPQGLFGAADAGNPLG